MSIWSGVKSFLGFDGVTNTALKIVDKIAGTDWTPEQKADYTLKYMEATKHQSPTRRVLAILISSAWLMFGTVWVVSAGLGNYFGIQGAEQMASDVLEFMEANVNVSFNLIVSFYFIMHFKK